eukprot:4366009-Pleurochrysis_carterae.AAC.1
MLVQLCVRIAMSVRRLFRSRVFGCDGDAFDSQGACALCRRRWIFTCKRNCRRRLRLLLGERQ